MSIMGKNLKDGEVNDKFHLFECPNFRCSLTVRACGLRYRRANFFMRGCYLETSNSVETLTSFEKCVECPTGKTNFDCLPDDLKAHTEKEPAPKVGRRKKYDFSDYMKKHGYKRESALFHDLIQAEGLTYEDAAKRLGCPRHVVASRVTKYGCGKGRWET